MPTAPIIIPVIIAGVTLGSLIASGSRKITKKRLLGVSLLSGLLNSANAAIIYMLFPPPSFGRFGGGGFTGGTFTGGGSTTFQFRSASAGSSQTSFLVLSFVTGFLIVLAIVEIALIYARRKTPAAEEEEPEEPKLEDEEET